MLIEDILSVVLDINDKTRHTVFLRYYGHVDCIDIDIHEGGWDNNPDNSIKYNFKTYETDKINEVYYKLEKYLK